MLLIQSYNMKMNLMVSVRQIETIGSYRYHKASQGLLMQPRHSKAGS